MMANYYTNISCLFKVDGHSPEEVLNAVNEGLDIWSDESAEDGEEPVDPGVLASCDGDGVWIRNEESAIVEAVVFAIEHAQELLGSNEPFVVEWANGCSRPRTDAYGGGAALIQKGYSTQWFLPWKMAEDELRRRDVEHD